MLEKVRFVRIGAASLGVILSVAMTGALWISLIITVATMFGTTMMNVGVSSESTAHQIAEHPFKQSHDLLFYLFLLGIVLVAMFSAKLLPAG